MDPITAFGLLASLCSLIEASNTVLKVMKSFKDGEKELLELSNDVSVFEEALKGFDRVLRSRQTKVNISARVINSALEEGFATIRDLDKRLAQISKSDVSAMRRMKWVQNKSSFKKLHERLKEQSTILQTFLALAHAFVVFYSMPATYLLIHTSRETFLAVCSKHPEFLEISSTVADEIDGDALSVQESILSETTTIASRSSTFSLRRTSVDTSPSSIGSSTSSFQRLSLDTSPKSPLVQFIGDSVQYEVEQRTDVEGPSTDVLTVRRACRYDCYCKCHTHGIAVSNKGFWRSSASRHRCTEPSCQGATSSEEKVVTTSTFFHKAISQVLSSKSIKVRYNLNTYRMVSEGSDAMRYVKHGNLEKLKLCINTGEATLWDTAPDGWSLLHVGLVTHKL